MPYDPLMTKGILVAVMALAGLGMAWSVAVGGADAPAKAVPAKCAGVLAPGQSC